MIIFFLLNNKKIKLKYFHLKIIALHIDLEIKNYINYFLNLNN